MPSKNIRIQVWTNLYYAKFIGIWRPEEEAGQTPDPDDPRPGQEQNLPWLLVLSAIYKGRQEVIGNSPVAPSQHPMPPDFMKRFVRQISYLFANEYGIFKPPTKSHGAVFLEKQTVGYTKVKEVDVVVQSARGSMNLKELRDHLHGYEDEWLKQKQVLIIGENPDDTAKRQLDQYIYTPHEQGVPVLDDDGAPVYDANGDQVFTVQPDQYITITKIIDVYDMQNPYIKKGQVTTETIAESLPPGTEDAEISQDIIEETEEVIAADDAELELLKQIDKQKEEEQAALDSEVAEVEEELTRDQVQQKTIADLKKRVEELESGMPII